MITTIQDAEIIFINKGEYDWDCNSKSAHLDTKTIFHNFCPGENY